MLQNGDTADGAKAKDGEKSAGKAKKPKTKHIDLNITEQTTSLNSTRVNTLQEREVSVSNLYKLKCFFLGKFLFNIGSCYLYLH